MAEASHGVSSLKLGGSIACWVTGRRRWSPLEQGGLEVPCELAFSGTKQLTKNVCVQVRTYNNTGWALARMSTHASRSKGEGWALTRVPPQIAAKNGGWTLTRARALTRQNTVYGGFNTRRYTLVHGFCFFNPLTSVQKLPGLSLIAWKCVCAFHMVQMFFLHISHEASKREIYVNYKITTGESHLDSHSETCTGSKGGTTTWQPSAPPDGKTSQGGSSSN